MPIKTIQPFVSNFNAFAGEGFYGNVVQGLVIKQLEDAVFIFGIAIDGTLIFRKRNYPDVSTWENPKIIIHSNNWHKIYSKPDLGGLLGINDTWFRFIFVLTVDSEEKSKSLTENGFYICVNESISPYDNTFLIVLSAQNDNTVVQFLVSANGKSVKVRTKWWGDGWSEWNFIGSWYK